MPLNGGIVSEVDFVFNDRHVVVSGKAGAAGLLWKVEIDYQYQADLLDQRVEVAERTVEFVRAAQGGALAVSLGHQQPVQFI